MLIDLHTHSTASDGTDEPGAVVRAAAAAGLDVVALTDHDTTRGWDEAVAATASVDLALVRGAELSAAYRGVTVHLLSYLHDPHDRALLAELDEVRRSRLDRARRMVDRMSRRLPISWDDVVAHAGPDATVGRPHIADALVARGLVTDRDEAFAGPLRSGGQYDLPHYAPDARALIAMVLTAGGVPVLAHPAAGARGRVVDDAAIRDMADHGLAGLEVHHRDNGPDGRHRLAALAEETGLLVTGSSDYHGDGKPNRLGEFTTDPDVLEEILAAGRIALVSGGRERL